MAPIADKRRTAGAWIAIRSEGDHDERPQPRIAFVQSCWHKDLVDQIKKGFIGEIAELGTPEANIDFFEVTGAFEIPLHARGWPRPAPTMPSSPPGSSSTAASTATSSSPKR